MLFDVVRTLLIESYTYISHAIFGELLILLSFEIIYIKKNVV